MGEPDEAIAHGKKALRYNPKADVDYTMGLCHSDLGDHDEAIKWLNKYLEKESDPTWRRRASDLIQDLSDDKSKVKRGRPNMPDYLDELIAIKEASSWRKGSFPIKVYFQPADSIKGYRPTLKRIFLECLDEWCEASDNKLAFKLVSERADAKLVVAFTDKVLPYGSGRKGKEAAGLTYTNTLFGAIQSAKIDLEVYDNDRGEERSEHSLRESRRPVCSASTAGETTS